MINKIGKIIYVFVLLLSVIIIISVARDNAQLVQSLKNNRIGRYQLVSGSYETLRCDTGVNDKNSTIFKIDTATGSVDKYASTYDSDKTYAEGWWRTMNYKEKIVE